MNRPEPPMRSSCAIPRASLRSVLITMADSAPFTCRVSSSTTSNPAATKPACSHCDRGPLQPDPRHPSLQPAEEPDQGLRLARHLCLAHDLADAIHYAHAAVFQRHVDPGEMLHDCPP